MREGGAPKKNPWKSRGKWGKWDFYRIFLLSLSLFQHPLLPPPCVPVNPKIPPDPGLGSPPFLGFFCSQLIPMGKKRWKRAKIPETPQIPGLRLHREPPEGEFPVFLPGPQRSGKGIWEFGASQVQVQGERRRRGKIPGFGMGREKGDGDGGNGVGWEGTGENGMKWGKNGMKWEKNWMKWGEN